MITKGFYQNSQEQIWGLHSSTKYINKHISNAGWVDAKIKGVGFVLMVIFCLGVSFNKAGPHLTTNQTSEDTWQLLSFSG